MDALLSTFQRFRRISRTSCPTDSQLKCKAQPHNRPSGARITRLIFAMAAEERKVSWLSDGLTIRGQLLLPAGLGPHPAVVLGHGFGALKEWDLPELALELTKIGFATLYFDYRNTGESDGLPRNEVLHHGRIEDWRSAISFLSGLAEIDAARIGIWGTSLGGRDVIVVGAIDRRVKAVLAQTPLVQWHAALAARMGGYSDTDSYLKDLSQDHIDRTAGMEPRYVPFVKEKNDEVKAAYVEQLTPQQKERYTGLLTMQSYAVTSLVNVVPFATLIAPTPVCVVLATQDFLPGQAELYDAAQEPKSRVVLEGNHFSPYLERMPEATQAALDFFERVL